MGTGTTKLLVLVILVGILAVAARRRRNAEALPAAAEGDPWEGGGQVDAGGREGGHVERGTDLGAPAPAAPAPAPGAAVAIEGGHPDAEGLLGPSAPPSVPTGGLNPPVGRF